MAKFLVTGGAGFIGSNLVEALLAAGDSVRVLDDFSSGHRRNLDPFLSRVDLVEGSVSDPDAVGRAVAGVDYVLHHAAVASVPKSLADPGLNHRTNVDGTLLLLEASREQGVRRLVLASSSAVYGDGTPEDAGLPREESMAPDPLSPYAASKLIGEVYCRQYASCGWVSTVSLRYFNVYGPRQDPASDYAAVIPIFIGKLLAGESAVIHGDGGQTRDFVHVENVVDANLRAVENDRASGGVFNVGCGRSFRVDELYRLVADALGSDREPVHGPPRPGEVRDSCASIGLAREVLGYEPRIGFEEGLERTCAWFRENPDAVRAGR